MPVITNHMPTAELQALDAAHHMHPFTTRRELAEKGARVITRAKGVYLTDSEGNEILDAMAGLWCVNIGYGRDELADVAARQMRELPYYNTFFKTTHVPAIALADKAGRTGAGRSEPRVLCRRRLGGQRHQYPHGASLLGEEGQARKSHHHQPQERLSRLDDGQRLAWRHGGDARPGRVADPRYSSHQPTALVGRRRRYDPKTSAWPAPRTGAGH